MIILLLPLIVDFEVMSDGGLVNELSYNLKGLMLKKRVALGRVNSEIDFNFIKGLKYEKLFIKNMHY